MCIGQHARSKISLLGLRVVVIREATMALRILRVFKRQDSVRKARSCVGAQPFFAKCFPDHAGITV